MSDANLRQIRVLHIVSAGALANSLQQSLFMPLLTRLPRPRVKSLVACLSPGAVPSAVLRQSGVPTYDLALSRKRFSPRAFQELQQVTRNFRPDVIQAWGHTAQIISGLLRPRCDWKPRLVWSIADTTPLAKTAGLIDRQKLRYAAKFARRADRIVYSSDAAAAAHLRVGFPDDEHETIPPGVDATRFKPDFGARRKLREQLHLPGETFVIGMYAPFQPEYDFATLIKAVGELIKANPNIAVVLAGHGVQKGNAPLMALVGGGALATRVHLLGEWSDVSALYNACDVVCSSALSDQSRMNLAMAMLCGVPCVATGMGAQGEIIGKHGVAIEPGSPTAFVKGITRVMQMTPEKRTFMAQGARKHALANYVYVRSLQKYLQLYYDLIGRQSLVTQDLPAPEVDPTLTVPPALPTEAELNAAKRKQPTLADLSDPDSLESKVAERDPQELPKWRIEQEQERSKREAELAAKVAASQTSGDVLQVFEAQTSSAPASATPMTERARGVADEVEDLLSPDLLTVEVPMLPRASSAPSGARKSAKPSKDTSHPDAAKQAALKAAQKAALQPIAPAAKRPATVKLAAAAKGATSVAPAAPSVQKSDLNSTQPLELLSPSAVLQTSPAPIRASAADANAATQRIQTVAQNEPTSMMPAAPTPDIGGTIQPMRAVASDTAPPALLPEIDLALPAEVTTAAAADSSATAEKVAATAAPTTDLLPEIDLSLVMETPAAAAAEIASAAEALPATEAVAAEVVADRQAAAATEALTAGQAVTATEALTARQAVTATEAPTAGQAATAIEALTASEAVTATEALTAGQAATATEALTAGQAAAATEALAADQAAAATEALTASQAVTAIEALTAGQAATATEALTAGRAVIATEAWTAGEAPAATEVMAPEKAAIPGEAAASAEAVAAAKAAASTEVAAPGNAAAPARAAATAPKVDTAASPLGRLAKALATATVPAPPAMADSPPATASMAAALEKWNSSFDPSELSLMATGAWSAKAGSNADAKLAAQVDDGLSGPEALSLISNPPAEETISATAETLKLAALPESAAVPRRAANAK